MTVSEFKAFLEGMGVEEAPTPKQWARIKEKIDTLTGYPLQMDPLTPPTILYGTPPVPSTAPDEWVAPLPVTCGPDTAVRS